MNLVKFEPKYLNGLDSCLSISLGAYSKVPMKKTQICDKTSVEFWSEPCSRPEGYILL